MMNQPVMKNVQLHDLKPTDILIERFVAWKAIVQQLIAYFEGIANIESNTANELTKLAGVIQVPFRAGNQFLGEGGLQDVFYSIRDETQITSDQHADLGRTVERSIVQHLQKLRADIKTHIKNVQDDTVKSTDCFTDECEISTRLVSELTNDVSTFKNTPMNIAASKNDPYIANQAVARQLKRQVLAENLLQKSIALMQRNSAHLEEEIVRSIQTAWRTIDEWQSHASPASQDIFRSSSTHLASLTPNHEWIQFAARSDHLLDPDTPLKDPALISYPLKNDPSVFPVHVGRMECKKRLMGAYTECYFVLTPTGFLHEFSTADLNGPGDLVPTFSLFLPSCTLGPVSPPHSKNHEFHIRSRLGTTISKSGSFEDLEGCGGCGEQEAWSFRFRSKEDMLRWWDDIRMVYASDQVERIGLVEATVRTAGHTTEEESGEEYVEEELGPGGSDVKEVEVETLGDLEDRAPQSPARTIPEKNYVEPGVGPTEYTIENYLHPTAPETRIVPVVGTGEPAISQKEKEVITFTTADAQHALTPTSLRPEFKVLEQHIQTLTSILQKMKRRHSPTSERGQVPAFLRHLATLLTCDDQDDADAKRVIAVTGSLTGEELRTLVVAQNPFGPSQVSDFGVKEIRKSNGTFEEVVNGEKNPKLPKHISDVWAAIELYDPSIDDQFNTFCRFIITRCFRKLSKRVSQDKGCWDVSVSRKIYEWTPLGQELDNHRWIERPVWALRVLPHGGIDGMREREIEKSGKPVIQWEFSAATLKGWAWLLAKILQQVELAIRATKVAREKKLANEEIEGLDDINDWCLRLYAYVHWKEDVVRTLLTETSLAHAFNLRVVLNMGDGAQAEPDEPADMWREPGESEGQQVLRHLQAIVAWHAAAKSLLDKKHHHIAHNLHVGLVEVTATKSNLMTDEEVIQEFFRRQPALPSGESCISISNIIRKNHTKKFTGTTHAEATLMGLLTYFSPHSSSVIHGNPIDEASLCFLRELVVPATFEKAIAVGKKCCWCCDRLGKLLGDIKLPGSHGVLYSWTPPRVGIDVTILQALENELWDEMNAAIGVLLADAVSTIITRQSSGSSTVPEQVEDRYFKSGGTRVGEW